MHKNSIKQVFKCPNRIQYPHDLRTFWHVKDMSRTFPTKHWDFCCRALPDTQQNLSGILSWTQNFEFYPRILFQTLVAIIHTEKGKNFVGMLWFTKQNFSQSAFFMSEPTLSLFPFFNLFWANIPVFIMPLKCLKLVIEVSNLLHNHIIKRLIYIYHHVTYLPYISQKMIFFSLQYRAYQWNDEKAISLKKAGYQFFPINNVHFEVQTSQNLVTLTLMKDISRHVKKAWKVFYF